MPDESSVKWSLTDDGVLTISGTGAIREYGWSNYPWNDYKENDIKSVVIGEDVTNIPGQAFWCTRKMTSVSIPASVTTIGNMAFTECGIESGTNLVVTIADGSSLASIGGEAFRESKLASITIPASVTTLSPWALATVTLNSNPYIDTDAFMGISPAPQVTMNLTANPAGGANWMTFCSTYGNFQADANTQVFKAELSNTGALTLHEVTDKIVDKGQGVILKSTGNPMMTQTMSDSLNPETNNLFGVDQFEGFDIGGSCAYVLNNGSQGVGFYLLAAGKTLGYGKAFLRFTGGSTAPSFLGFSETTGINAVNGSEFMVNGSDVYNLKGQRVAQPTKGLYIVNGKKFVIK